MSLNTIISSIQDYTLAAKQEVFNDIKTYLLEHLDDSAEVLQALEDFKEEKLTTPTPTDIPKKTKKQRASRSPTKYNLFIADKMAELKEKDNSGTSRDRMKAAINLWRMNSS